MSRKQAEDELDQQIIHVVETAKPETTQQLIDLVQASSKLPKEEILNRIIHLQQQGKIRLKPAETPPQKLTSYLTSNHARWYWITMALTVVTAAVVFTVPEDSPVIYVRNVLGLIYVLWLPGYAFIKALFPQNLPFAKALQRSFDTSEKNLDAIERIALSLGMSLALVPIVGLMLNYTPWGIQLAPTVLSLLALTTIFATAAVIREYQTQVEQDGATTAE